MILARFRRQAAEHNWFAAFIDLLIVVIGVFLGLQVSDWSQARGERSQAHEDRQRLIGDLDNNLIDYANRRQYFRAVQRHAEAALAVLNAPAADNSGSFLIDAYQASQITPRAMKRVTYDEILATGRLTRLGDAALRYHVGSYVITQGSAATILDFVPPYRERLRRALPGAIQLAIRRQCPERYDLLDDGTVLYTLADQCTLRLDPTTVAAGVTAVRGIPDVASELNRVIGDAGSKLEAVDVQVRATRMLRAQIEAADARS